MSHYLVELYTPNAAWKAMPAHDKQVWLASIQAAMGGLATLGVELLSLSAVAPGIAHNSQHQFIGIWRFASADARNALLAGIQASGWYQYFDHLNAACESGGFESHLAALQAA